MHHGQTDKMDRRTGLILQGPFHKDGGLIMLFGNSRIKFSEIVWLDSESYGNTWKINTWKRNTINIVQCSKSSKTMILSKFK